MAETRVGIVGGLGPESTIDYYRRLFETWQRHDPSTSPAIVIDSLDVQVALQLVERERPALIDGVTLGGTELPLLLRSAAIADLPMLDTTALHVDAIVERMRAPI